jgi:outer membrane lipoprotein-sorting protein
MFEAVLTMALFTADTADPIQAAIDHYREIVGYQATIKSMSGDRTDIINYYFKKPGYVRMKFVAPFKGAELVYDPRSRLARLWPFGYGSFPSLSLSPDSRLIRSSTGQRVDRSDVGVLYSNVKKLQGHGATEVLGIEKFGGSEVLHIAVSGKAGFSLGGVSRYQLWLDGMSGFPLRVMSYAKDGGLLETVEMEELKVDPRFPDGFFRQ